jgi:hypothetical protein
MRSLLYSRIVAVAIVATLALAGEIAWASGVCHSVNGLNWCYNPDQCGEPCNQVCAAAGLVPVADDAVWFAAQDTPAECQAIATAFGLATVDVFSWTYACLEDGSGTHSSPGGLLEPLLCSSYSGCPANHRTSMDGNGTLCGDDSSRRSICPCELAPTGTSAPAIGTVGLIVCTGLMLLLGVTRLKYRRVERP